MRQGLSQWDALSDSMRDDWTLLLPYDPIPNLLSSKNAAVRHFTRKELTGDGSEEDPKQLPEAKRIVSRQRTDGS